MEQLNKTGERKSITTMSQSQKRKRGKDISENYTMVKFVLAQLTNGLLTS